MGTSCQSLNVTDIHTTWVETCAVMGKSQVRVQEALEHLRQALPFALRGIDSDNGSEFINAHLYRYCRTHQLQFTRGRPYKKDDNAHIEQKNWTHVRKLMGYVRYDSEAARTAMNAVYADLRLLQNLFLAVGETPAERTCGRAATPPLRRAADPVGARPTLPAGRPRESGGPRAPA